jgi:hypothetical protein
VASGSDRKSSTTRAFRFARVASLKRLSSGERRRTRFGRFDVLVNSFRRNGGGQRLIWPNAFDLMIVDGDLLVLRVEAWT